MRRRVGALCVRLCVCVWCAQEAVVVLIRGTIADTWDVAWALGAWAQTVSMFALLYAVDGGFNA